MAYQHSFLGGDAVYQARVMLWIEVPDTLSTISTHAPIHKKEAARQSSFKLYPNPNNGSMILEYKLEDNKDAVFFIYAMDGRLVKQRLLNGNENKISIDGRELDSGIYYCIIKEGDKKSKTGKLVIVK